MLPFAITRVFCSPIDLARMETSRLFWIGHSHSARKSDNKTKMGRIAGSDDQVCHFSVNGRDESHERNEKVFDEL
jgi:hypothetical protein